MVIGEHKSIFEVPVVEVQEGLSSFKLFQDQFYTQCIEFEYPEHWLVEDLSGFFGKGHECRVLCIGGPWNRRKTCYTKLYIQVAPMSVDNPLYKSADEGLEQHIYVIRDGANKLREVGLDDLAEYYSKTNDILSDREIKVDGNKARELVIAKEFRGFPGPHPEGYKYKKGERFIERYVAFEKTSYAYQLSYQVSEEEDGRYVEAYRRLLSTFRVLPCD